VQRGGVRSHEQWVESGEVAEESRRKGGMKTKNDLRPMVLSQVHL
jgi:tRNA 2-selenouridine synthase SelU